MSEALHNNQVTGHLGSVRAMFDSPVSAGSPPASADGVALAANDLVFLANQTNAQDNGVRVWNASGLTFPQHSENMKAKAFIPQGAEVAISEGTVYGQTKHTLWANVPVLDGHEQPGGYHGDQDFSVLPIGGGSVSIPNQRLINGPLVDVSPRSGWWAGWTPVYTTNQAAVTSAWLNIGAARTAPNEISDLTVDFYPGCHYLYHRRCRIYLWIHWRILVNGAPVYTATWDYYRYNDEMTDSAPLIVEGVQTNLEPFPSTFGIRLGVPAGASVQVQAQTRHQVAGAQSSAYARYIGGLRSRRKIQFLPRNIVIGRI